MKALRFLFFVSLTVLFLSCRDDDDNSSESDPYKLRLTSWKGMIFEYSEGELQGHGPITLQITTETRGTYEYKFDYQINSLIENFEYKAADKLMQIKAVSSQVSTSLKGDWVIEKLDEDSLVLSKNAAMTEALSNFIKLKKVKP